MFPTVQIANRTLARLCGLLVVIALIVLGIRSAVRFEDYWDSLYYHLPFAAERAGLHVTYDMSDEFRAWYEGFPPLAEFVQGLFWRITGQIQATVVVGYLTFIGFLYYCHRFLRAPFWLVGMIALSAPLVIIHSATNYIDLFGNSFLALGLCSALSLYLFPDHRPRVVFLCGLFGLSGAMWTKFLLVPPAAVGFLFFLLLVMRRARPLFRRPVETWLVFGILVVIAAIPYLQNWIYYDNPFWPVRVPLLGKWFPYMIDGEALGAASNRPPHMLTANRLSLFIHSLFEINHPTGYDFRARWLLDQGSAPAHRPEAFRMGGFWAAGVVTFLSSAISLLIKFAGRRGFIASFAFILIIGVVSQIPQSHELRYYLFIPLCWAVAIAMFYPHLKRTDPLAGFGLVTLFLGLFIYMASENREHYTLQFRNYFDVAQTRGMAGWWKHLKPDESYCAVGMPPAAIMLTGPTMKEFRIYDRSASSLCPENSIAITFDGILPLRGTAPLVAHTAAEFNYRANVLAGKNEFPGAIKFAKRAVRLEPSNADAYNNLCFLYGSAGKWDDAIAHCTRAVDLRPDFELARNNLAWATAEAEKARQAE